MEDSNSEKMVLVVTHGSEDPEMATLPFVVGNAALAMDVPVTMVLQAAGVTLMTKGIYEHIFAAGFDPLKKLVDSFIELGGKALVCTPCIQSRQISEDLLLEGTETVKAARVVQEVLEAKVVLNY
jgi:uncharacterized protein